MKPLWIFISIADTKIVTLFLLQLHLLQLQVLESVIDKTLLHFLKIDIFIQINEIIAAKYTNYKQHNIKTTIFKGLLYTHNVQRLAIHFDKSITNVKVKI